MNKYIYYIASCLLILQACGDDPKAPIDPEVEKVTVGIVTEVLTKAAVTTEFGNGDQMNVYAKTYGKIDAPDFVANIKATYTNGKWDINPPIKLSEGEKTFIYAIAPYNDKITNLASIPIDIADQQDVLYSGNFVPVTYTSNQGKLTMKHALALTSYNISKEGYSGAGVLKKIGFSGEVVYTKGTMNIENGKIAGTEKGSFTLNSNKQIVANGWSDNLPRIWSIPFSTIATTATLKVVIDDKEYDATFPEIEMKSGFQYIFRLILTNYGLEFIPDQTQTISLNQESDQMSALEGHAILKITHRNALFDLPLLTGDNVFGFVNWGDNTSDSYSVNASHNYSGSGEKEVVIESWNSTGFEMKNLIGVETIDLTRF